MSRVPSFELRDGPEYVYVQVEKHLEARIGAGEFPAGSRLGNEREMAAEYGVSLVTFRKALRRLAGRGLVVIVPSKGAYPVAPGPPS